jgi:5-methylthioadenosine/S-adenosylhomocysteine deaminase
MTLAVTDAMLDGEPVGLRAADGRIVAIGDGVQPEAGDQVVDGRGLHLVPGMVNAHTHAAMTLFRSYGDDLPLMTWLQTKIWPAEARLEADDVYWGTRLACVEMIRSGTTRFADMYWHAGAAARAVDDAGMRAILAAPLLDHGDPDGKSALVDDALRSLDELAPHLAGGRIMAAFGPHAVYTVTPSSLEWIGATARERDIGVHIHLAETRGEVDDCVAATGLRPTALLDRCGMLGPKTIVAHGCWLEPDELALLAEREATIATNPVSNMKLAVGRQFPYLGALAHGVAMGLGTDGASSNNALDLFSDVKVFALAQKFAADDPAVLPAHDALAIARGQRSAWLGGRPLAVGEPADFLLVAADVPEMATGDLDANLVYAADGSVVDTTVVDGRVLMERRRVADVDEIVEQVRGRMERLVR